MPGEAESGSSEALAAQRGSAGSTSASHPACSERWPGRRVPARARAARYRGVAGPGRRIELNRAAITRSTADRESVDLARSPTTPRRPVTPARCFALLPQPHRAASLGAHREAAAQYARALDSQAACRRTRKPSSASTLSYECYLDRRLRRCNRRAARRQLDRYRRLGDALKEGDLPRMRWRSCCGPPVETPEAHAVRLRGGGAARVAPAGTRPRDGLCQPRVPRDHGRLRRGRAVWGSSARSACRASRRPTKFSLQPESP